MVGNSNALLTSMREENGILANTRTFRNSLPIALGKSLSIKETLTHRQNMVNENA